MIRYLGNPGRKFRLIPEPWQVFKCFQINVLSDIFPVFDAVNHFENDLSNEPFGIFNNNGKGIGIATQNLVNQKLICLYIFPDLIHLPG